MPSNFVINPYSITFEAIQNDLRLMIAKNQTTFTDFFNDASGSSVLDTAAALGAFFAYHIITQRRESSLEQATSYKSLIGNAYDKGYNVSRGTNVRFKLSVTPNTTGRKTAWTNVGTVQEYDVVLMKDVSFTKGVQTELEVVIGNRGSEGKSVTTNKASLFRFVSDDITDDIRLFLNNKQVEYTTSISDLLSDKYLVLSNSFGSVNVFYLNTGENKYDVGNILAIDYISRNNLTSTSVTASEFYLNDFIVNDIELLQERVKQETKDSIRIGAALHAETSGVIKARADFKKVIQEKDDTIKSINDEEIQPGRIGIMILKKDYEPLTEADKIKYNNLVANNSVTGVANLYYTDAHKYDTPLNVTLIGEEDVATSPSLLSSVEEKINDYKGIIGKHIDFLDIESYIEKELSNIKVARITVDSKPWQNTTYRFSDTCIATNFNNKTYYVAETRYLTGSVEPNWDSLEDDYVVDNDILWKEYSGDPEGIMLWTPNVNVKLGKLCVNNKSEDRRVFEAVRYVARTGSSEPAWIDEEQIIYDNEIVWSKIPNGTPTLDTWSSNKLLKIGETIEKIYDNNVEESYEDNTMFTYNGNMFGVFYTAQALDNGVECFSDEKMENSIGVASDIDKVNKIVTITPINTNDGITGTYLDLTQYKYLGGITGTFYTSEPLAENVECFSDSALTRLIGTAKDLKESEMKLKIVKDENIRILHYRVSDYAVKTGSTEPDWTQKTLEGFIEDGTRIRWKEAEYPIRFIELANNTYADFQPNITMD